MHLLFDILSLSVIVCLSHAVTSKQPNSEKCPIFSRVHLVALSHFFLCLLCYRALHHTRAQLSSIYGFLQVSVAVDWGMSCDQKTVGMLL